MRKKTHVLIARAVADHLNLCGFARFEFIVGAVYPDIVPTVFIKPHTWGRWLDWANCHLQCGDMFHRGCALHLLCDFYTHPHNASGYLSYQHMRWEADLKNYFKKHGVDWYTAKCDLRDLHFEYLHTTPSIVTDWEYCCRALSSVYALG